MSPQGYKVKRWVSESADDSQVRSLAAREGIPYLPALVLWNRGYRDAESVKRFLNPRLEHLCDPFKLPDMEQAVERLLAAQERQEKVLVHGDYDVDGVTGTALLVRGLARLGIKADSYLPHRMREGYGLSAKAIDAARECGASLVLTVDCGITAIEEARMADKAGIDLVITDHHEPGEVLPRALAVVDPKREDSTYPFAELAGVGVAYKLLEALSLRLGRSSEPLQADLDLVALGTIADVAPLIAENRVFARLGLERISKTEKPGLVALLEVCKLKGKSITASHVAFGLAPRLNASGRMADAKQALRLLLSTDMEEARSMALKLEKHNRNRRQTEDLILEQARIIAEHQIKERDPRVLVCYRPNWHEGVIGIVASRIVDEFYRPTVLLAEKDGRLKGSARSVHGFHLHEALVAVRRCLVTFGGHEAAAGLVMEKAKLKEFTQAINKHASTYPERVFEPRLRLEAEVELDDFDPETRRFLERFRPFGMGNPEPCFATRGLEVVGTPRVFAHNHLKFTVRKDETTLPVLAFGKSDLVLKLEPGRREALDIAYRIAEDTYWGKQRMQLIARDLKLKYEPEDFSAG
jgi:single-stranded-DNA-specific exonuclease